MLYKLIAFDIDGTITRHVSSWRYIHEKLDLWDALAKKYQDQFLAGRISYRRFCELDAAHWKGIREERLRRIFRNIRYSRNARKVVHKLKSDGFKLIAISTGLQFVTERVKQELGFDHVIGNRLNVRNGILTGGVRINISHGAKGRMLRAVLDRRGIKPREMIAVGDSEGDIPMVKMSGYSIAFNSSSEKLSAAVDYNCETSDFMEVYRKITDISERPGKKR